MNESPETKSRFAFLEPYRNLLIFLLFLGAGFLFFWKPLLTGEPFYGEDFLWQFLPMNHAAIQQVLAGHWPLWNPYMMSGMPLFASLSYPLFYPGSILFYVMSESQAVMLIYWLQLVFAGYFTYRCVLIFHPGSGVMDPPSWNLRLAGIFAGLSFMLAGNVMTLIYPGHTMKLIAATFIPIVMFCLAKSFQTEKRGWFLLTGFVLSLQIFTLHYQVCYYTWLMVGCYAVIELFFILKLNLYVKQSFLSKFSLRELFSPPPAKAAVLNLLLMGVFVIGTTAVQWIPFYEYTRWCTRSGGMNYQAATEASYPPEELLSMMMVSITGDDLRWTGNPDEKWSFDLKANSTIAKVVFPAATLPYHGRFDSARTLSEYLGVFPFLLGLIGLCLARNRHLRFFKFLAVVALILCLGKFNPIYPFFLKLIPGLAMFRVPAEILLLFCFSLAILAGMGMMVLLESHPTIKKMVWVLTGLAVAMVCGLYGCRWYCANHFIHLSWNEASIFRWGILVSGGIVLIAGINILKGKMLLRNILIAGVFAVFIVDMWTAHLPYLQTMKIEPYYFAMKNIPTGYFIKQDPYVSRFLPTGSRDMVNNKWHFMDLQSVWGYQSFPLKHYDKLWLEMGYTNPNFRKLTNVKYITSDVEINDPDLELVFDQFGKVYRDKNALTRIWFVDPWNAVVQKDERLALQFLKRPDFNPVTDLLIDEPLQDVSKIPNQSPRLAENQVLAYQWTPGATKMKLNITKPMFLVISEIYYPGWKCRLNSVAQKVYRADYILNAVYLPTGTHDLEFYYAPFSFFAGLWISILSLVALLGYWVYTLRHSDK